MSGHRIVFRIFIESLHFMVDSEVDWGVMTKEKALLAKVAIFVPAIPLFFSLLTKPMYSDPIIVDTFISQPLMAKESGFYLLSCRSTTSAVRDFERGPISRG